MKRLQVADGVFVTEIPSDKFKRCKVAIHLVVNGERSNATELALLPHVLDRRYEDVPDAIELSRRLFALYGAELTSESYTAGPCRVLTLGVGGVKNEYALAGEDLAGAYLQLACGLLTRPLLQNGAFMPEDVAIEKGKQEDFLKSEMNDKRGYCLRQARRKLYGNSVLGLESAGYLEDLPHITPQSLHAAWLQLLKEAQIEVMVCGIDAERAAAGVQTALAPFARAPRAWQAAAVLPRAAEAACSEEPMATVQGKLALLCTSGQKDDAHGELVMRMGSALLGGLPTSRLFMNVREKQSLCYYCACSYGYYSGLLTIDSGIDHQNAQRAADAILKELHNMQTAPVSAEELENAKRYMKGVFSAAKDSPDALMNFAFGERLKGFDRTLDEVTAGIYAVTAEEVQAALARFAPAVQYTITEKKEAAHAR